MCSGAATKGFVLAATKPIRDLEQQAEQQQAQLNQIAAERAQVVEQQQAELARLQQQQMQAAQGQAAQSAQLETQRQQQQQTLDQARLATQSVAASMRVLQTQPATKAPTAQTTRQRATGLPRATSGSQSLRIGNTAVAPGVGMNIGG